MRRSPLAVVLLAAAFACTGDKTENAANDAAAMAADAAAWKQKRLTADSLLKAAPTVVAVREKLGGGRYVEADSALAAAVRKEAEKTRDCYINGLKNFDATLSMVVYMLVNYGAGGWDLVRVEDRVMSSEAGGAVETCINMRAKQEWNLPTKGIQGGAYLVKLVFTPDSARVWTEGKK